MSKVHKKETSVTPIKKDTEIEKATPLKAMSAFEEMDRMFDDFFPRGWMRPFHFGHPSWSHLPAPFKGRTPHVDIVDRESEVFIKAELPGVDKDDVEITLTENSVTIKGSTRAEEEEEKGDYHRCEISQGTFSRTLSLPSEVDTDKARAKFKHGVLKLTIPKLKKSKHKSIKVE
ncbi:MAG: Hsp20/alpha crystallin family protein [Gammaproteobacteria bacterium]|nr:Hsp20/alpha crystallin family protein [Gammaproteobacteria bacterium]